MNLFVDFNMASPFQKENISFRKGDLFNKKRNGAFHNVMDLFIGEPLFLMFLMSIKIPLK
jgi:hypothetical protein